MKSATKPTNLVSGLFSVTLILLAFNSSLQNLSLAWQKEEYSHAWFIPFIALFLAWHRLTEARPVPRPSWLGVGGLALAGLMLLTARLSAFDTLAQYGLIVALTGWTLAFLGREATRAIAPALIYLLFAVPLPHMVEANLSQQLQLLSSTLGVWPLDLLGIPVFQEGNVIDLGGYRLQVVEACSGLRYLFPLMSFGYLIAFLLNDRMWKRAVIFLSTIPITIGMNSLRLAIIGITVDMWGIKMAEGFIHVFEGWTIFLACVAILLAETWLLLRIGSRGNFRYEYLGFAHGPLLGRAKGKAANGPTFVALICAGLFAALFTTGWIDQRAEIIPAHPPFASFPLKLGDWNGKAGTIEPEVLQSLQLSDYWIADYRRANDNVPVNFYMAYYASQRFSSQAHSPSLCIPGGGWHIDNRRIQTVKLADGAMLTVTRMLIRKGDSVQMVYYWFDERGRDLTESYIAKWYLLQDSMFMHRTDGALIRLVTMLAKDEDEPAAEGRLKDFLEAAHPYISNFVPGAGLTK